jgi:hypothetical protein
MNPLETIASLIFGGGSSAPPRDLYDESGLQVDRGIYEVQRDPNSSALLIGGVAVGLVALVVVALALRGDKK